MVKYQVKIQPFQPSFQHIVGQKRSGIVHTLFCSHAFSLCSTLSYSFSLPYPFLSSLTVFFSIFFHVPILTVCVFAQSVCVLLITYLLNNRGFLTRMMYLYYISCLRYTILIGNPRYAHRSRWSIGHQRPPSIALCSGLLLSFRTSWSPAVSALLQCLASKCCEAGLSSSSPVGSRSGLGVWCWMLASWRCVRSSSTSSAVCAWPLVPVLLASTDLHFGSSLSIGFCRCASDRCWRMSGSFVASSVLSTMSHIRKAGLTSHWSWSWSWRCRV